MATAGAGLQRQVDVLDGIAARIPGGLAGLTCAQDADVVALVSAAQAVVRSAQGVLASVAGEVARRSASRAGDASLARRLGERSARQLLANRAAISFFEAARLVDVGEAIRPNVALHGEELPPDRPHIAAAVADGALSVGLADLIDRTVAAVSHRLVRDEADVLERELVAKAVSDTWSVADFTAYCRRIPNILDPEGARPRDERLSASASIRETQLDNGMLRIVAELDPERAAYYLAAMRARTNPRRAAGEDPVGDDAASSGRRDRTLPTPQQSKLDAFLSILRDSLKADTGAGGGIDTTVLVRIDLQDLLDGVGTATVDGVDEPISAAAARRMAAEADVIPQVLGGRSVVLDQGHAKRLFTRAQRYAILAAFAGCAFPKCGIPSAMTEIHHIGPWATRHDHGRGTDQLNGLPLCGFHNRLMEQGWQVALDRARIPWFTPPPTVDPFRTPLRGGGLAHDRAA